MERIESVLIILDNKIRTNDEEKNPVKKLYSVFCIQPGYCMFISVRKRHR